MSEDKNLGNSELNAADELTNAPQEQQPPVEYTDDNIRHLSDMEHVRTRPGMYIGRLGDVSACATMAVVFLRASSLRL